MHEMQERLGPTMQPETLDVLVIGAGISGLSAAWHLYTHCIIRGPRPERQLPRSPVVRRPRPRLAVVPQSSVTQSMATFQDGRMTGVVRPSSAAGKL
jgi:hypothetical protein